jgi:FkbM family methyltransferase
VARAKKKRKLAGKTIGGSGRTDRGGPAPAPKLEREEFFRQAVDHAAFLGVEAQGAVYMVSTKDRGVGQSLFLKRSRGEMRRLEIVLGVLGELGARDRALEGAILDVGANIGTTSIHAVRSLGFARAVAIEPLPENFRLLRINVIANDLEDRFRTLRYAISDEGGTARLTVRPTKSGSSKIRPTWRTPGKSDISVPQTTLDTLVANGVFSPEEIGLLWLDVQGHEGHVLNGAQSLTSRGTPIVLEFSPRLLRRKDGLDRALAALRANYTDVLDLRKVVPGKLSPLPVEDLGDFVAEHEDRYTDLLALRRGG